MPYLGNPPAATYSTINYQDLTGGSGTSFTLDHSVANENEIEVFVNNVRQEPSVSYTTAGTALTMTGSILATDDFYVVFQGKAQQTITPGAGTITTAMIQDGSVTAAKLASGAAPDEITKAASDPTATTNASLGDVYVNSTTGNMFVCTNATTNNNTWRNVGEGSGIINPQLEVSYLVIAGGGGGGSNRGGGGGAGGYRNSYSTESSGGGGSTETVLSLVTSTNYTVTVGAGGAGGTNQGLGSNGSNSVFSTITSTGGGGGSGRTTADAQSGGSGGGSAEAGSGGAGTSNQGFAGGTGNTGGAGSAGGGGAGSTGFAGGSTNRDGTNRYGDGGAGLSSSITGSAVGRGGGGGGGADVSVAGVATDGGGNGKGGGQGTGNAGIANTGGGGGNAGSSGSPYAAGGAGGSGVVILRYSNAFTISNPGGGLTISTTTDGSDKVSSITAGTGNVSWS